MRHSTGIAHNDGNTFIILECSKRAIKVYDISHVSRRFTRLHTLLILFQQSVGGFAFPG